MIVHTTGMNHLKMDGAWFDTLRGKWCVFILLTNNQFQELREHSRYLIATIYFFQTYCSFVTRVSQLKICDFAGENFKGFWSAIIFYECNDDTTALQRQELKLPYDTIPVKNASANVYFYTNN